MKFWNKTFCLCCLNFWRVSVGLGFFAKKSDFFGCVWENLFNFFGDLFFVKNYFLNLKPKAKVQVCKVNLLINIWFSFVCMFFFFFLILLGFIRVGHKLKFGSRDHVMMTWAPLNIFWAKWENRHDDLSNKALFSCVEKEKA